MRYLAAILVFMVAANALAAAAPDVPPTTPLHARAPQDILAALDLAVSLAGLDTAEVHRLATPPELSVDVAAAYARLVDALALAPRGTLEVPSAYAPGLVRLLDGVTHAVRLQHEAVDGLDTGRFSDLAAAFAHFHSTEERAPLAAAWADVGLGTIERTRLAAAARALLLAAEEAAPLLAPAQRTAASGLCIEDPLFLILVCGPGDDVLTGDRILVVDVAGNDVHLTNAGGSGMPILWPTTNGLPVALSLDLLGDDTYEITGDGQGTASTTAGVLVDLDGHDTYRATARSFTFVQGAGNLGGVGVLYDAIGNDQYLVPAGRDTRNEAAWNSQGFGILGGIGLLFDPAGSDTYVGGIMAMGVGDFDAVGLLLDLAGDDGHDAVHWSQGFGDGGGTGVVWDVEGNDVWVLDGPDAQDGRRGQGAAIGGTGILLDDSGNDRYFARGESQGWAVSGPAWKPVNDVLSILGLALPGTGLLVDGLGDDVYGGSLGCNGCVWTQESGGLGVDDA